MVAPHDAKAPMARKRPGHAVKPEASVRDPGAALMQRPGVLIRRLHQVHSAMFQEETAGFGVTPVQYSLLTLLMETPGIEQGVAAAGLRLDRFTTADVVRRVEAAGLLRRKTGLDRRARTLFLTRKGIKVFEAMQESVHRAHERLVEPLPERRRGALLRMLQELVDRHATVGAPPPRIR